jgi:hypothetical protein
MNRKQRFMQPVEILVPEDRFIPVVQSGKARPLPIQDSLQIKAAEYWLKLGEADQALRELEALPSRSWNCGWALSTRIAAMEALRAQNKMTAQA